MADMIRSVMPRDPARKTLPIPAHFPPHGRGEIYTFDYPCRGVYDVETWMAQARHEASAGAQHARDLSDRPRGIVDVHQCHVADRDVHTGVVQCVEPRGVGDVVDDAERTLALAQTRPLDHGRAGVYSGHARTHAGEAPRKVPVAAREVEQALSLDRADDPQQRRVDERPVPEVTLVALLRVVPRRHRLPGAHIHLGLRLS